MATQVLDQSKHKFYMLCICIVTGRTVNVL